VIKAEIAPTLTDGDSSNTKRTVTALALTAADCYNTDQRRKLQHLTGGNSSNTEPTVTAPALTAADCSNTTRRRQLQHRTDGNSSSTNIDRRRQLQHQTDGDSSRPTDNGFKRTTNRDGSKDWRRRQLQERHHQRCSN
jgi:hypothetical protein